MNIHPLTHHYSALGKMPGVVGVQPTQGLQNESITIQAEGAVEAAFLDDILADSIKGYSVEFGFDGPATDVPQKVFYPAEEIVKDYGQLLKNLPGVSHLGTMTINAGEMLPAFETCVEVVTGSKAQAKFVDELLESKLCGTRILVRSEN